MQHDSDAVYYLACPDCACPLDPATGRMVAQEPARAKVRKWSVRISQFDCAAMSPAELVGSWYAALRDASGQALIAFFCDRVAKPRAGASQPITPTVLERSRLSPVGYNMALARGESVRVAGMDTGPRCWLIADELVDLETTRTVWAEMVSSGQAADRVTLLRELLRFDCIFIDAGGEPELAKHLALTLNGLDTYTPPVVPANDLRRMRLSNIGDGLTWDGEQGQWSGVKCATVEFSLRAANGVQQTVGITVDGKIYPLIKCNRSEAIQMAVNDFLTPKDGMVELVQRADGTRAVRQFPRARLPMTYIGPGVSQTVLDTHLQNLRKVRDPRSQEDDWATSIENHLGLAKVYSKLAATVVSMSGRRASSGASRVYRRHGDRRHPRAVIM